MKIKFLILILLLGMASCNHSANKNHQKTKSGAYMGEELPGDEPKIFAPNFVTTGLYTRDITIAPAGDEIFFSVATGGKAFIMETHIENESWTIPKVADFSGSDNWRDFEPHISPDGKRFFMLSTRPPEGMEPKPGWFYQNIWAMDKTETGWTEPYNLGHPVCTENDEFYATATYHGTLYFTRGINNQMTIMRSKYLDGKYQEPEKLIFNNDTSIVMYNATIAPDESFLISCVNNIVDSIKIPQYYISFRNENDEWTNLIPFDEKINFPNDGATSTFITADMKYMFFASSRKSAKLKGIAPGITINNILEDLTKPGNGQADIYWVSTSIIGKLKP